MKRISAYAAIYVLWGASFLAIRVVVQVMPPFFAASVRFLVAGLMLVAFSAWRRLPRPVGVEWRNLLLLAIMLFVGDYALLFWVERKLSSGLAAVTAATIPSQVYLLEWLWLRRIQLTAITAVGLLLGLAGVAVLVLPADLLSGHGRLDRYAAIGLVAACCWAAGSVVSTMVKLPKDRPVSAGWQMTLGGAALLALSLVSGEWARLDVAAITPRVWAGMAYLIVFASLIAFSAYVYLLQQEPTGRVASYAYVNPVIALFLGATFGGEALSMRQGTACLAIIGGVALTLFGKRPVAVSAPALNRIR